MAQQYTRKMIRDVFIRMLNEKSLDMITVTDLVAECEINRKTFYYYYSDLYAILTELFETELKKVVAEYNETRTWEDSFLMAAEFALENKKAIYHIYYSLRREELEQYLYNIAGNVMTNYVKYASRNIHAYEADKHVISCFYQSALTEMVLRWIAQGMKEDPEKAIRRIGQLFDGNIAMSLKRSASLPPSRWEPTL